MKEIYDVAVIGAGVTGCAAARELSRYDLSVAVIEKESDVCEGTSKANSAIIHAGFDAKPGTLKARLNVRGNALMDKLAEQLRIPFRRNGAFVVCREGSEVPKLEELLRRGEENGVTGLRILSREEAREMEPNLDDGVFAALYAPTSGIVCPFEMTIALAENACANGAEFMLSTEVTGISKAGDGAFDISTDKGAVRAKCVINCAGVYADRIHDMICEPDFRITARRGEYMLLDTWAGNTVDRTIFQLPTKMGKGVLVTPTVHGNLLVGPTADDIEDKEDTATTRDGLANVRRQSALSVKNIPYGMVITSFSGLRAAADTGDFIIREDSGVKGFIDAAGIESPGLTSAPAIAEYLRDIVAGLMPLNEKKDFVPAREGIVRAAYLPAEERAALIAEHPEYGQIVCRCSQVSEGEIADAINRPLGATTIDGVKRRTGACMGRCQGGFCSPKIMTMLAEKQGISLSEVKKNG
ncbi:MAG: NAD(P)/FAD-dependent oxidoreductase [Ruminiclostridium sp.]|nr:NAD(P)/FAD-dependent oxidoreductase [Ruminiclostridium sp.]